MKSDLMSNLLLLIVFIDFWKEKYEREIFKETVFLGVVVGFFCLTRGVVLIPLILMLFAEFVKVKLTRKVTFFSSVVITMIIISFPVLWSIEDFKTVIENNPFNHQTKYAPVALVISALVIPFFLSRSFKSSRLIFITSFYIFCGLLLTTFILNVIEEGIWKNVYGKAFELSYLGMIIPFSIMTISEVNNLNIQTRNGS